MDVAFDAGEQSWSLGWQGLRLHVRLQDGTMLADYFGPAPIDGQAASSMPGPEVYDALTATRADAAVQLAPNDRRVFWSLQSWTQPDSATVSITLRATDVPLQAVLSFEVDRETGILLRKTTLAHTGSDVGVEISHAGSMTVVLPPDIREVVHTAGRWGAETQVQRFVLPQTALLLESRSGKTGFEFLPYVALLAPQHTYFTQLFWSGNWQYYIRRNPQGRVVLAGGLNPWGLRHSLTAGDTLALPDMLLGCVAGDLNAATHVMHRYLRRRRPDPDRVIPVQFNSWFPYQGEPPVETMKDYAKKAGELSCEVFVQDAGWYTTQTENPNEGWWLRTGDWLINRKLFPNGLEELSDYCRQQGMDFGIWIEPEAVGPSAIIRHEHPEWLHNLGGRAPLADQRAILNLGVPNARAWIRERMIALVRSTAARWLKWDFNIDLFQGGWAQGLPPELTLQDPLVAHYRGLYLLADELREALPDMILEVCSSGGSRFDAELMSHAHAYWISDQTHPLMKLAIHFGSQLAHPPEQCNDWLVEWPPHEGQHDPLRAAGGDQGDLAFRIRIAMLGSFGVSAPVDKWSEADVAVFKQHADWYKQYVRPVIRLGDQYLLTEAPPLDGNGDWAAVWYALPDATQGTLFAFRLANGAPTRTFALPGLDPSTTYTLKSPEGWSATATGAQLAQGIGLEAEAPFRSVLLSIEIVKQSKHA